MNAICDIYLFTQLVYKSFRTISIEFKTNECINCMMKRNSTNLVTTELLHMSSTEIDRFGFHKKRYIFEYENANNMKLKMANCVGDILMKPRNQIIALLFSISVARRFLNLSSA